MTHLNGTLPCHYGSLAIFSTSVNQIEGALACTKLDGHKRWDAHSQAQCSDLNPQASAITIHSTHMVLSCAFQNVQAPNLPMKVTFGDISSTVNFVPNGPMQMVVQIYMHLLFTSNTNPPAPIFFTTSSPDIESQALFCTVHIWSEADGFGLFHGLQVVS